ncbi:MAG TPA: methyltransferase domain-containing protein [Thermoanaerobaculia bacterium]|nr:methyltransferase domain-containing protein [Thermoanaerobaculia bacterium]
MPADLPYRDFYYPLNVFMYVLSHEEGGVRELHYGLFQSPGDSIAAAQERSTTLLLSRLPPPPATLLEAGIGLGTTLARLKELGYEATGITPDLQQVAMVRARYGDALPVFGSAFESFQSDEKYDAIVFQESAQYIDAAALFARARELTGQIVVLDEFALRSVDTPGALHSLERFLVCAGLNGFTKTEEIDLSAEAAPTVDYFLDRLPRYRDRLIENLGVTATQITDLIESGRQYRERYRDGVYGYRLLTFTA